MSILPSNPEKKQSADRFCNKLRDDFGVDNEEMLKFVHMVYGQMAKQLYKQKCTIIGQQRALCAVNMPDHPKVQCILDNYSIQVKEREIRPIQVHPKERYYEEQNTTGSGCKITINPCTGRVTLKLSSVFTPEFHDECRKLAKIVMKHNNFKAYTYRGKIQFSNHSGMIKVTMQPTTPNDIRQFVMPMRFGENFDIDKIIIKKD